MDSVPRYLRDALNDVEHEADRAFAADRISARTTRCLNCNLLPAPGSKLRYNCGRCEMAAYCRVREQTGRDTSARVKRSWSAWGGTRSFRCAGRADKGLQPARRRYQELVSKSAWLD